MSASTAPDIPVAAPSLSGREAEYVADCLRRGWITSGPYVQRLERDLEAAFHMPRAAACSSGTTALHLALLALGVKPGDEVLVPALTYVATANAVTYCGAKAVFCDVDPVTWTVDPAAVDDAATSRTVGIIAVHLYGVAANMRALRARAVAARWWVVEDAAEAVGTEIEGRPVGEYSDATTLSFYGNKTITCGEGGAVLTWRDDLDRMVRLFRGQGVDRAGSYDHQLVGYNYRLSDLHAAVACAQLERMAQLVAARQAVVGHYRAWADAHSFGRQHVPPRTRAGDWMFTMLVPSDVDRDAVAAAAAARGVQTRPAFPVVPELPMYDDGRRYPIADAVSKRGLTLPTHAGLTAAHQQHVCDVVADACQNGARR